MRSLFGSLRNDQAAEAHWRSAQGDVVRAREMMRRLVAGQRNLAASLEKVLFRHYPININFGTAPTSTGRKAESIAMRLPEATSEHDLFRVTHEDFVRWFDAGTAGSTGRSAAIVQKLALLASSPRDLISACACVWPFAVDRVAA